MGREHYFPASLIGCFNVGQSDRRHRNRSVWVADREDGTVKERVAHKVGWNNTWPQPYSALGAAGVKLDESWQALEKTIRDIEWGLAVVERGEPVPALWYTGKLVPYVAHLLARHPQLFDARMDLFASTDDGHEIAEARSNLFYQFTDALMYERRAILVSPKINLLTSDRGWLVTAGPSPGDLFVPFSLTRAVVFRGDGRTYLHGDETVYIPTAQWCREWCELRNDAIAITAPHQIYAPTEQLASHALAFMLAPPDTADPEYVLAREYSLAQPAFSALMLEGAAADPVQARRRVDGCGDGSSSCQLCKSGKLRVIDTVHRFSEAAIYPRERRRGHFEFEIYVRDSPNGGMETLSAVDGDGPCSPQCQGAFLLNEHPLYP